MVAKQPSQQLGETEGVESGWGRWRGHSRLQPFPEPAVDVGFALGCPRWRAIP